MDLISLCFHQQLLRSSVEEMLWITSVSLWSVSCSHNIRAAPMNILVSIIDSVTLCRCPLMKPCWQFLQKAKLLIRQKFAIRRTTPLSINLLEHRNLLTSGSWEVFFLILSRSEENFSMKSAKQHWGCNFPLCYLGCTCTESWVGKGKDVRAEKPAGPDVDLQSVIYHPDVYT